MPIMYKVPHINQVFKVKLDSVLNENLTNPELDAELVAHQLALSKSTLNRKLKAVSDTTINHYIRQYRLEKAIAILFAGYSVREVSKRVGFKTASYFAQCFKKVYQRTPMEFLKTQPLTQY